MPGMEIKTNVMRTLDKAQIKYKAYSYDPNVARTGGEIAAVLNQDPAQVFKTLVTINKNNKLFVFMVPVDSELDLKLAATSVGEKSLTMLPQRDLLNKTGYIHGGCSPIGMKKIFPTVLDSSSKNFETIICSAGRIGHQIEISVSDLGTIIDLKIADICE